MAFFDQIQIMAIDGASTRRNPFGKAIHAQAKLHISSRPDGLVAFNLLGIAPTRLAVSTCDSSRRSKVKQTKTLQCKACEQGFGFALVVGGAAQRCHDQERQAGASTYTHKSILFCGLRTQVQSAVKPF